MKRKKNSNRNLSKIMLDSNNKDTVRALKNQNKHKHKPTKIVLRQLLKSFGYQ